MIVLLYKYSEINPKKELSNQTSLKKLTFYLEIVFVDLFLLPPYFPLKSLFLKK